MDGLRDVRDGDLAGVVPRSAASLRALEKCGFVRSGTDGERTLLELGARPR